MTMKILLVENDFYISELLTEVLTEHNFVTEAVFDGLGLLTLVKQHSYDLIILNVLLPKLNGIYLCRQLRVQGYNMPILFWSSQDSSELQQAALEAGANDYIVKPSSISTLLQCIHKLLSQRTVKPTPTLSSNRLSWSDLQVAV